ncbi:MAG: LexA family protein [Chitinophagaceae bacterium]
MEEEFFGAAYKGSKKFTQQDVKTANATGFGAAADDFMERGIDLNEQLIMNKPATFFFRMNGEAMIGVGIYPGDVLIVDRSLKITNGKIVVAAVNGELVIRRFLQTMKGVHLMPENKQFKPIEIGEFTNYNTWGVVTCAIHMIEPSLLAYRNNSSYKNIRDSQ